MDTLPRVTVITPSFNQARYLGETIRSVLNQQYPHIEYFIIDGGSTDGSLDIIKGYETRLAWWVSEKDRGQADAINKGLRRASGELIAWLNSDDVYLEDAVTQAVQALNNNPDVGLIYSDVLSIDAHTRVFNAMRYGAWDLEDLMSFRIIGQPGVFFRRNVLEQAGFLDPSYQYLMDHHLWLRIASVSDICHLDGFLAAARYHADAKNVAQAAHFGREAMRIVQWMAGNPALEKKYQKNKHRILSGAHRFSARYLMDAGQIPQAISQYIQAIRHDPLMPFPEYRRFLYAVLSRVVPMQSIKKNYLANRGGKIQAQGFQKMLSFIQKDHISTGKG